MRAEFQGPAALEPRCALSAKVNGRDIFIKQNITITLYVIHRYFVLFQTEPAGAVDEVPDRAAPLLLLPAQPLRLLGRRPVTQ